MMYIFDDALAYFSVTDTSTSYSRDRGPRIDFAASIRFILKAEVDEEHVMAQIQQALVSSESVAAHYLDILHKTLDPNNPFQQTSKVEYLSEGNVETDRSYDNGERIRLYANGTNNTSNAEVVGAFAGAALILSISGYLIHGKNKREAFEKFSLLCGGKGFNLSTNER